MSFVAPKSLDNRGRIIEKFLEMYDSMQELKDLFNSFFTPDSAIKGLIGIDAKESKKEVAEVLVDYLGLNFFSTAGKNYNVAPHMKNEDGKYLIRQKLLEQACRNHEDPEARKHEVLERLNEALYTSHADFGRIVRERRFLQKRVKSELMSIFEFPDIVFDSPPKKSQEEGTTVVNKKQPIKPLYDYQTQAVVKINNMLSRSDVEKRVLINVPTGAGKTRLTVEAIINWINDRDGDKIPNASLQQRYGRVIFWFASTNELCSQAASEFVNMYEQIGEGRSTFNVTRLYDKKRQDIFITLNENPGTHVVVTNTEHFQRFLKEEKGEGTYHVDQYENSELFKHIREQTIAVVIDEAHEAIAETYRRFLAAMGFDFSGRNRIRNRNGIVLIGLTATPYKGSGRQDTDTGDLSGLDEFIESDKEEDPTYFGRLDKDTKRIHKMFHSVYIPLPEEGHRDPDPVPAIEAPGYAHTGKDVRISGLKSFDNFSELKYEWAISKFGGDPVRGTDPVFYHRFADPGKYNVKLTVTNKNRKKQDKIHQIDVYPGKKSRQGTGNLNDNKEFNLILQKRNILCRIIYGVIDGPQLYWDKYEIDRWKKGRMSEENEAIVDNDKRYNEQICNIIDKAINKYGRKRVLVFANGVSHAHNIALILSARYKLKAKSVDGTMNSGLRRQTIHDFREGSINVLCNHGILTSGFDVPQIDTLLICRTVGSNALYTQMIGRGQRGKVAGGTEDLWLITAYFKKGKFDDIRLGWEALADTWEKFPDSIKEDLKIKDSVYVTSSTENATVETPQPADGSKIVCKRCDIKAVGHDDARRLFGIEGSVDAGGVPECCLTCDELALITEGLSCGYCKNLVDHHDYDPVLVMIAWFANHIRGKNKAPKFADLQGWLRKTCKEKVPDESFGIINPSVLKAQRLGFVEIRDNLNLSFPRIDDPEALDRIAKCIMGSPSFIDALSSLMSDAKDASETQVSSKLESVFGERKSSLGHTPTSRQFGDAVQENKLAVEFKDSYGSQYARFLSNQNVILKDDWDLRDSLYSEYFEKCMAEGKRITRSQLDEYGEYRMVDYEEVFGPFGTFQTKVDHELKKILKRDGKEHPKNDLVLMDRDLSDLREKIGRWPHFDDLRIHSSIGAHQYPARFKISRLKYLKRYDGPHPGKFLMLVEGFFRLKEILKVVPDKSQFVHLTTLESTVCFGDLFGFNYDEFLHSIGAVAKETRAEHALDMAENTLNQLLCLRDESGLDTAMQAIDDAGRNYDALSISIRAWWPDKKKIKFKISPSPNTSP